MRALPHRYRVKGTGRITGDVEFDGGTADHASVGVAG